MSTHAETVGHLMRARTRATVAVVEALVGCTIDQRAELRGFLLFVTAKADELAPICAITADEKAANVVQGRFGR